MAIRDFTAKDGTLWRAFPADTVEVLDDPSADDSDTVVLVLDRKRAGALAVLALHQRNVLGALASVLESFEQIGIEGSPIAATRTLGTDLAIALGWDVAGTDREPITTVVEEAA